MARIRKSIRVLALLLPLAGEGVGAADDHEAWQTGRPGDRGLGAVATEVAVAIKGGGSLGAYEAGVNWGLLRILKEVNRSGGGPIRLVSAAGASAGAVNGVMTAVYWCGTDLGLDTVERNVFSDGWRNIDISDLIDDEFAETGLPDEKGLNDGPCANAGREDAGSSSEQNPEDAGIFSRRIFRETAASLQCLMERPVFTKGCDVAVGLSLTRAEAVRDDRAGIEVSNQRMVVPLLFASDREQQLAVQRLPLRTEDTVFNRSVIHLDDMRSDASARQGMDNRVVFSALKASSSFPVAFAPIKLDYCLRYRDDDREYLGGYRRTGHDHRCPPGFRRVSSYFVDGGVFDNDPVALVRHLADSRSERSEEILFVNIDPGRRRPPRGLRELVLPEFAAPGDSLDIELRLGRPLDRDGARSESITATALACRDNDQVARVELNLHATGPQLRRYVGAVHTCDSCAHEQEMLPVTDGDSIRVFVGDDNVACGEGASSRFASSAVVLREPQGLSTQLSFVRDAVESGRNAQLYGEIVGEGWRDGLYPQSRGSGRLLFQPARLTALTGEYLASFGGFLERRFRDYDYYAGIYDAIYSTAEFECSRDDRIREGCLATVFESLYLLLCPTCGRQPMPSNVVIRQLVHLDLCGPDAIIDDRYECDTGPDWGWIDSLPYLDLSRVRVDDSADVCALDSNVTASPAIGSEVPAGVAAGNELLAIGRALACADRALAEHGRSPFRAFILRLAQDPRFARDPATPLGRMLAKAHRPAPTWYYPLTHAAVSKLLPLEREDEAMRAELTGQAPDASGAVKAGLAVAGLASEAVMADRTGWQSYLGSIPASSEMSRYAPFLPNELALDVRNGGVGLYWEAGWQSAGPWMASMRATPYLRQVTGTETVEFAELTGFITYRTTSPLLSSYGLGPTYTQTWSDLKAAEEAGNWGASAQIGLIGDRLRLTYGLRSFDSTGFAADDAYWQLSFRDLPGIWYWASQAR